MHCIKCGRKSTGAICGSCSYDISSQNFISAFALTMPIKAFPKRPAALKTNNVLMSDGLSTRNGDIILVDLSKRVFGSNYTRKQINTITFLGALAGMPWDAWDVSEVRDRSVMAWVKPNGKLFDLYIGAEGGVAAPGNCEGLFHFYEHVSAIYFNDIFDTSRVTDMSCMFAGCSALESLDVSGFDTANVTDMHSMFYGCNHLTALDLSGFDTANVFDMMKMFCDCSSLTALDLSSFNTAYVHNMGEMFSNCSSLTALDLSSFDTAYVHNMGDMFSNCRVLESLDLSCFDIDFTSWMDRMFKNCEKLTKLHVKNWSTADRFTRGMFDGCALPREVVSAILSGETVSTFPPTMPAQLELKESLNTKKNNVLMSDRLVKSDSYYGAKSDEYRVFGSDYIRGQVNTVTFLDTLADLPDDAWDVSEVRDRSVMAWVKSNGKLFDLYIGAEGGIVAPADCSHLFAMYERVSAIHFNGIFDTSRVTDMSRMFQRCSSLRSLDLSCFDTANVINMGWMFFCCSSLTALDISGFDTANVINMERMFDLCEALESLNLSGFNTANVIDMRAMFEYCSRLTMLHVNNWNSSKTKTEDMFDGCTLPREVVSAILSGETVST